MFRRTPLALIGSTTLIALALSACAAAPEPGATDDAGAPDFLPCAVSDLTGFDMTSGAYSAAFPVVLFGTVTLGQFVASVALMLFAFTTLITWGYYGERAVTYMFGSRLAIPWRVLWCVMAFVGSFQQIDFVWRTGL